MSQQPSDDNQTRPCTEADRASFQHAVEVIGRRWTAMILCNLGQRASRFVEIRSAIPGITDRALTDRLHELHAEGLVERSLTGGIPRYALTATGKQLLPALDAVNTAAAPWQHERPPPDRPGRIRTQGTPARGSSAPLTQ